VGKVWPVRRLLVLLALLGASLLSPSFASAAAPLCPGSFGGCVGASPASPRSLEASFAGAGEHGDVGDAVRAITTDAPARRAGAALIAAIWAMTILGFGTVAVLLRRTPPPPEPATA
jgi:hypothetical protein